MEPENATKALARTPVPKSSLVNTINTLPVESRPKRATREETRSRIALACEMLSLGYRNAEIHKVFREKFSIGRWRIDILLRTARDELVKETKFDREELIASSYSFYLNVAQNKRALTTDRLRARKLADDLLGLEAPKQTVETHIDGTTMMAELMKVCADAERPVIVDAEYVDTITEEIIQEHKDVHTEDSDN